MGERLILPKFDLPRKKVHWAVRAAWAAAGLLLVSVIGLGVVVVRHRALEARAELARDQLLAKINSDAEAKAAAEAAAAHAAMEAARGAELDTEVVPATTVPAHAAEDAARGGRGSLGGLASTATNATTGAGIRTASKTPGKSSTQIGRPRRKVSRAKSGTGSRTSPAKPASGRGAPSSKPDAIDELLRKMK